MTASTAPTDAGATPINAEPTTGFAADPGLPARDRLLDERTVGSLLGSALGLQEVTCRRVRTKYRLGESLRVSYEVTPRSARPLRVSLRGFAAGHPIQAKSSNRLSRSDLSRSDQSRPDLSRSDLSLPEVSALGWVFPGDRKLTSLRPFWNDDEVRRSALGISVSSVELMAYAPEKSATIRCGVSGRTIGFAKLYAAGGDRESVDVYRRLGPLLREVGVVVPDVQSVDQQLGLVLYSPAVGETLASRHNAIDWYRLGLAAAQLHGVSPPMTLPRFERATMARLRTAGQLVAAARPDVAPLVESLLDVMDQARHRFEPGPDVLLHGDLHGKNVLCDDQHLTFIDLDQAAVGPAAAELGSAIAALRYDSAIPGTALLPITTFETHLLEGYRHGGDLPSPDALAWHIAAALLGERALRAVNRVRLDGLARLPLILRAALSTVAEQRQ